MIEQWQMLTEAAIGLGVVLATILGTKREKKMSDFIYSFKEVCGIKHEPIDNSINEIKQRLRGIEGKMWDREIVTGIEGRLGRIETKMMEK